MASTVPVPTARLGRRAPPGKRVRAARPTGVSARSRADAAPGTARRSPRGDVLARTSEHTRGGGAGPDGPAPTVVSRAAAAAVTAPIGSPSRSRPATVTADRTGPADGVAPR